MNKDFKIRHTSVEVIDAEQHVYDVHNCYKFRGINIRVDADNSLEVLFVKISGEWVKESDPSKITFVFRGVKYLEFSKLFFVEQSSTIDELGYKAPEDNDYDWLMSEEHFTGDQHFVFRFVYGEHLRIFADSIELVTGEPVVRGLNVQR